MLAHGECAPPRLLSVGWLPYQAMISERGHGPSDHELDIHVFTIDARTSERAVVIG